MRYLFLDTESVTAEHPSLIRRHDRLSDGKEICRLRSGESLFLPQGNYLIDEETAPGRFQRRYLGVAGKHTCIIQFAIGYFTGDALDCPLHSWRVPANYYVVPHQVLADDSTLRHFEKEYGDVIYPHLQPNDLAWADPAFAQSSADWESLTEKEIVRRLLAVSEKWEVLGFRPLHGFASYTPSNTLIRAMRKIGWKVLHSIVPEQNWNDGFWTINHWGMLNQPFYVGEDDFRHPVRQGEVPGGDLLAMTMNSYHLYMPHVTHWGDNVLSPSHFLRWHRSVESGDEPLRFRAFLNDYLHARESGELPYFLTVGCEFGRTYGMRNMVAHNRRGAEIVLETARERGDVIFANGWDTAQFYFAHPEFPGDSIVHQRDYLAGTRIMDKPVDSGPSIGVEFRDFKAAFPHGEALPFYHYDYRKEWHFSAGDPDAPEDFAKEDRQQLCVRQEKEKILLSVPAPLSRTTPIALWDAVIPEMDKIPFETHAVPVLDDGRRHTLLVLPKGFCGETTLAVQRVSCPPVAEFQGSGNPHWKIQQIDGCCYVFLDFILLKQWELPFVLKADAELWAPDAPLGKISKGSRLVLKFSPRRLWYRFRGIAPELLALDGGQSAALDAAFAESQRLLAGETECLPQIQQAADARWRAALPAGRKLVLDVDCCGSLIFGEVSRAAKWDRIVLAENGLSAAERTDGGMAFGAGKSYWVHPQLLRFLIRKLDRLSPADGKIRLHLMTHRPPEAPEGECVYRVRWSSGDGRWTSSWKEWVLPDEFGVETLFTDEISLSCIKNGALLGEISSAKCALPDEWYADRCYIAGVARVGVSVTEEPETRKKR